MAGLNVYASERPKASVPLSVTPLVPLNAPAPPPLPNCNVPPLMVVAPV